MKTELQYCAWLVGIVLLYTVCSSCSTECKCQCQLPEVKVVCSGDIRFSGVVCQCSSCKTPQDTAQVDFIEAVETEGIEVSDFAMEETQVPEPTNYEFRGIWVTRWDFSNKEDIKTIVENAAKFGFNAVFFQVRGVADAYYHSHYEPWAENLTGTLGKDPGWDPLQVAIDEAHARGLELHAWINVFTAWVGNEPPPESDPPHILYEHPEWRPVDEDGNIMEWNSSYTWVSPGIPGVREHIINVAVDIVANYDVDGLHLDYVRYPGPSYSHDEWSESAYQEAKQQNPDLTYGDFQRQLLTQFVFDLYQAVVAVKPDCKVTAAVWGIYKDEYGWGGTSEGYWDYYQDSHAWISNGYIDAICPMVYWPITEPKGQPKDFATLVDDHLAAKDSRHVYIGIKADYDEFDEIANEIAYVRQKGGEGVVIFAYSTLMSHGWGEMLASGPFSHETQPPPMDWKQK